MGRVPRGTSEGLRIPARIDPLQRRQHVIEAAFRLVVAEGIDGLSLRKVAAESQLNIGSVRHYFKGHEDLLAAAAQEAGERMGRRLAHHPVDGLRGLTDAAALDALQTLIEEVLPVDEERRGESIVVLELILASRTSPVFASVAERMAADLRQVVSDALAALGVRDPEGAAAQLTALIGGLTLDTVTPHGSLSVEHVRATLRAHLGMLLNLGERK